jgi:hypothetical protein
MGMVKTPSNFNGGVEVPAVYEVGCVYCDPVLVDSPERGVIVNLDGNERRVLRRSFSARGGSPEEAVKRWNQGDFVEDQFIERMPGLVARRAG